ncbi:hypothetical protein J6590_099825, partial [Homalodisca vitripennis]
SKVRPIEWEPRCTCSQALHQSVLRTSFGAFKVFPLSTACEADQEGFGTRKALEIIRQKVVINRYDGVSKDFTERNESPTIQSNKVTSSRVIVM